MPETNQQTIVEWPTSNGIWMGNVLEIGWFPFQAKMLVIAETPIEMVVQWPESEAIWPFTFQCYHPVKSWRLPSDYELNEARKFYGNTLIK